MEKYINKFIRDINRQQEDWLSSMGVTKDNAHLYDLKIHPYKLDGNYISQELELRKK